ncbi:TOTE conflict system archaeo-eukaryotic primase domain-containing protein [Duganella sp. CT11-25]|uniref:TOTE conflict system archaeo-eukaryotic primase domain-containing protein n=1 Tax=unclassified Duganella TaxID=2636909 RepID=UPI0039AF5B67
MHKLISELRRLYLLNDQRYDDESLARHVRGEATLAIDLANAAGLTRALAIDFHKAANEQHWTRLCEVANALQTELGLPAPAVSVSGGDSYRLWLSLASPMPATQARQFLALLHKAYFEDEEIDLGRTVIEIPPCQHTATGLWAAFINPGMGASFAEELGLEMQPPIAAQAAFLEGLQSISDAEFAKALDLLQQKHIAAPEAAPRATTYAATPEGLLLKDATLEEIIKHLHSMNIEPTFRHLLKP